MQAINPVDVHVANGWRQGSNVQKNARPSSRGGRQAIRMRAHVVNKTKTKKTKPSVSPSSRIPKQVVVPKLVLPVRSRSSSSDRGPWVPPPGRSTKGQKVPWQNPKSRVEINPVTEILIDDDDQFDRGCDKHNSTINSQTNSRSIDESEKLMRDIQTYEKRIQAVIEGIGMLKETSHNYANQEQTDKLRLDIDSSLLELERLQQNQIRHVSNQATKLSRSKSCSSIRTINRSTSADQRRMTRPKVSFQDDPIIERRRARSVTPTQGPIHLNPDRERLLISLTESEADISRITKHIASVTDILLKLKTDDQPASLEIEQLHQHRNELLHLIEQFQRSNSELKEFLQRQYHLEAEHGIIHQKYDTLKTHIHELEHENEQIRHLLHNRENDNIALQTELERIKTNAVGFDTMKTSLEHNRAHLQRELYAKEGEINRLRCALRSLERDLQQSRHPCNKKHSSVEQTSVLSVPSPVNTVPKTKAITIERLQAELHNRDHQINDLKRKLYDNRFVPTDNTSSEIIHLHARLEQAERLANEYKAQLHTQTLKTSANNSKNHLSELELERIRVRLQKRIQELEPLPELMREAELKNEKLQRYIHELQNRSSEHSTFPTHISSSEQTRNNHFSSDVDYQTLQRKITSLEEQNEKLSRMLHTKEEELRTAQSLLNAKTYEPTSMNQHTDSKRTDFKIREDTFGSKEPFPQRNTHDLEQQLSRLRLEYAQLKREKEELERRFTSQLSELRDKLEQSNNTNRTMQNYVTSLKTTYATLFNDTLPIALTRYTTT